MNFDIPVDVKAEYQENGYVKVPQFLSSTELVTYRTIIENFHQRWLVEYADYYQDGAINSAYVTASKPTELTLDLSLRNKLFELIASSKLTQLINPLFQSRFQFMNTQVFFDPKFTSRKNYWHRDGQYHLSLDEQKAALTNATVLHCRIALRNEAGVEVVPKSHVQWDTAEELAVRLQKGRAHNYDDLTKGKRVALQAGDLLIFSANMLHRGLYGNDRLALDIIYCDDSEELLAFRRSDCLPDEKAAINLDEPSVFGF